MTGRSLRPGLRLWWWESRRAGRITWRAGWPIMFGRMRMRGAVIGLYVRVGSRCVSIAKLPR